MGNCAITTRNGTVCQNFNTERECFEYGVRNNVSTVWYGENPCPTQNIVSELPYFIIPVPQCQNQLLVIPKFTKVIFDCPNPCYVHHEIVCDEHGSCQTVCWCECPNN